MRIGKMHWIGIIGAVLLVIVDIIFFRNSDLLLFLIGLSTLIASLPFLTGFLIESNSQKDKNLKFLEFARNLAESVKTGNPIGKSILNMKGRNFGSLTPHITKLANQISIGIPINRALSTFAQDIGSPTIARAVTLIREAESAGGHIDNILDSVAKSIYEIEKLKKERKAVISSLVVEGYIIFFIFIGIMLIMQFKVLPLTADIGSIGSLSDFGSGSIEDSAKATAEQLTRPFLYLLIIQGIFTGFIVGKLSEGTIKAGIKHSFILAVSAFLISSGTKLFV